jgi:ABC-2 type transport system permease protein
MSESLTAAAAGFVPLYRRRVALAVKRPIALVGQALTPVLWVLVVGPALAEAFGGFARDVDYFSYIAVGQIVFILPFSAMFAGLVVMQDRDFGILRELLVAPIHRAVIPLASIAAILTVGAGQIALIVGLALARGATFHVAFAPLVAGAAGAALLTAGTYALAEYLAYTITQPQIFGTLIPAIGATPYALCGAIYPISALPEGVRQLALALPWTHAVALLRYGLIGSHASGLGQIWHLHSNAAMVLLSLAVLALYASLTTTLALRAFKRSTLK